MTSAFQSQKQVTQFYADLLAEHREGPRVVGWNTSYSQYASFVQLTRIDGFGPGARVLDLGCGQGDLAGFLDMRGIHVDYTGWDLCEPLVEVARRRHPDRCFEVRDILAQPPTERFDFVVCSGTMNLRMPNHTAWVRSMVEAMFGMCTRGVAFNLLSAYYANDHALWVDPVRYYYADPAAVMSMCAQLSRQVVVEHYGLPGMLAAFVYRRSLEPMHRLVAAIEPGPEFGPLHHPIIDLYESHGFYEELLAYLQALNRSPECLEHIAQVSALLDDSRGRRDALDEALLLDAESATTLVHLAILHLEEGRPEEALPLLERAIALEPDAEWALQWLERCREAL